MKKLFNVLTALALSAAAVAVAPGISHNPPDLRPVAASTPKIMVVGDSISQGSSGDFTWRYRLYRHLVASGVAPDLVGPRNDLFDTAAGKPGSASYADRDFDTDHDAMWGQQLAQAKGSIETDVRTAGPDVLLVLLGINDLTYLTDAAQTEAQLREFVTNARTGRADVKLVLGTVLPTQHALDDSAFAAKVSDFNTRIAQVASSMSTAGSPIAVAATATDITVSTDLYDGTHPNARGEAKIAAAFADTLATGLGIGAAYPRPLPAVPLGPQLAPYLSVSPRDGGARLSWTESPGATGYWVWTRSVDQPDFTRLPIPLTMAYNPWDAAYMLNGTTYEFKLQAIKGNTDGVFSNVAQVVPSGPTPGGVTNLSVASGNGEATLSWTAVANATGYYVHVRNVTAGETAFTRLPMPVPGPSWTAGLLENGATYEYKLESVNGAILGGVSNVVTAAPTGPTPGGVTNLSVTGGNGEATLLWTAVANATGYYVHVRNVTAGETAFTRLPMPVPGPSWTASWLDNGATYEYKLESVNGRITGGMSNVATANPTGPTPSAVTDLAATSGNGQAVLTWTPVANATGYYIHVRNATAGEAAFTRLPMPAIGSTWTAQWLDNGGTYEYKVEPVNGRISGALSNVATAHPTGPTPGGVTNLAVAGGSGQATLSWTPVANATGYYVHVRNVTDGEATFTRLPMPVIGSSWTAEWLENGVTYEYKLESVNGRISGGMSNVATGNPTGPTPVAPTLTVISGNRKATLSWTKVPNANQVYIWARNVTAGETSFTKLPLGITDDTWTADVVNGATYEYKVQAYNGRIAGGTSTVVSANPHGPGASGPNNLTVRPADMKAILSWTEADQATGYYIWARNVSTGEQFSKLPMPVSGATWTGGYLVNGMTYEYKLQSVDGLQPGGYSNTVSVVPQGPTPQGPTDLRGTPGLGEVKLLWTSTNVTGFLVNVRDVTAGESTFTELPLPVSSGWTATGKPGHQYQFKLQAVSGWQRGTYSNTLTVTFAMPPAPSGFALKSGPYSATVSWNAVPGADEYKIYSGPCLSLGSNLPNAPAPRSQLTLVQWGIQGTSWTQGLIFNRSCMTFEVVAVKNGVTSEETPRRAVGIVYILQENVLHFDARAAWFRGAAPLDKQTVVNVGTTGNDRGIVVARAFIKDNNAFDWLIGDRRSYSDEPFVTGKITVAWDTGTGKVAVYIHKSCVLTDHNLIGSVTTCSEALPIAIGPMPNRDDSTATPYNYVNVSRSGDVLYVDWKATNSKTADCALGPCWHIDGHLEMFATGASLHADRYPSYEFFTYPAFTESGFPKVNWIGYRDQTNITALNSTVGQQSYCIAVRPAYAAMSC